MTQSEELEVPKEKHGFIILVDALGTKGITAHLQPAEVVLRWRAVLHSIRTWTDALSNLANANTCIAKSIPFSDTVYICIEPSADAPLDYVQYLDGFAKLLYDAIHEGVFLRGAISYGRYFLEDTQVFGPAAEEAAEWYEQADWIGVTATPSLSHILDLLVLHGNTESYKRFTKLPVPFKKPELKLITEYWALAWPLEANDQASVSVSVRESFYRHGGVVSPAVLPKFHSTLKFIDDVFKPKPKPTVLLPTQQ